jgi:septal ring factor EnvC (AmiA/AmiB activator)
MRKIALLIISLSLATTSFAEDLASEQKKLKNLESQIANLSEERAFEASRVGEFQVMLRELDMKIGELAPQLQDSNKQIIQSQAALHTLKQEQMQSRLDLEKQQVHLTEQLRNTYLTQQSSLLKLMLSQSNPQDFERLLHYYRYFNLARQTEITQLKTELDEIAERELRIAETLDQVKKLQQDQLAQFNELQTKKQRREKLLSDLNKDVAKKDGQIAQLKSDVSGLNKIIDHLEKERDQAATHYITRAKGGLLWPTEGELLHTFGSQRHDDRVRWTGIFIGSEEGKPVKAVHGGRVVYADWLRGYGLLLIVDHGDDIMSLYAYNESLYKQLGDWVSADEAIATVGKSGGMSDPGLYFEIRQAGNPIDPLAWIKRQS